jgi:chemotaxis protein MotB
MAFEEQVIIVKKKGGHAGGHNGGAWKVAYADFVTAMMALFIVLWLMNSSKPVQEAVGGYFRDPNGSGQKRGTQFGGAGDGGAQTKEDMFKLKEDLAKALGKMAGFDRMQKLIELKVTPEGLQIEMMEDPSGTFFENGSAEATPLLQSLLKVLSPLAGKLPNPISIEGHTDSKPYASAKTYGNWELSADRANAARRLMESYGVKPNQIVEVRGYADRKLRKPQQPDDASNRRITVIIRYMVETDPQKGVIKDGVLVPLKEADAAPAPAAQKSSKTP